MKSYLHKTARNLPSQSGIEESKVEIEPDDLKNKNITEELGNTTQGSIRGQKILDNPDKSNDYRIDTSSKSLKKVVFKSCDKKSSKSKREKVGLDKWITNSTKDRCLDEKTKNETQLALSDKKSNNLSNFAKEKETKTQDRNNSEKRESHSSAKGNTRNKGVKKQNKTEKQVDLDKSKEAAKLKKVRKKQDPEEEETYIIESLLEKKGSKFLVKWEQFSEEWNSWEPRSGLPVFITKVDIKFCVTE